MISTHETRIEKHPSGTKLTVTREFNAPVARVWRAWTERELLDQWWAPKPFKTITKSLDLKPGGRWFYYMLGPEGEKHFCKVDYHTINAEKSFSGTDGFCDEQGNDVTTAPTMEWLVDFAPAGTGTLVTVEISFASEADLETIVAMGFKEGFTMAHGNLDELLEQQS